MRTTTVALILAIMAFAAHARADGAPDLAACNDAIGRGDNAGAIASCGRVANAADAPAEDVALALTQRSVAERNLQRYDDARADCLKAIAHHADFYPAQYACGNAAGSKGDYDAALAHFNQAIALKAGAAEAYNGRGNIYNQRGEFEKALADFESAMRLAPHFAIAQINRGIALYSLSRFGEAADAFEAATSSDSSNAYAVLWLVLAQRRTGRDAHMVLISAVMMFDLDVWPGPIVKDYQLALAPMAPVIPADRPAVALEPTTGEQCETAFYDGELDLLTDKPEEARSKLQQAADTCPKTYIEHAGALAELKRLSGPE